MSKNKKLSILVLEGDKDYEKINDVKPINFQSYHIVEMFMNYLPKIDLDGSNKLVIYFKEQPDSEKQYMQDNYFGVSWYYVDKIALEFLKNLKKEEVDEYYLNIIVSVFKHIAQLNNRSSEIIEIIDLTAKKVKMDRYEYTQKMKALSKMSEDKKYKANVYRHISNQGEIWYVEIEDKNKNTNRYDIMKKHSYVSKVNLYKKSEWRDGTFVLLDRFNKIVAVIDSLE